MTVFPSTSWYMSLSPVMMAIFRPSDSNFFTRVAMTSSASKEAIARPGTLKALAAFFTYGTCTLSTSGMGGLSALYEGMSSCLNDGPLASKAMTAYSGLKSASIFFKDWVKPYTALVGSPFEVENVAGMAWNARYIIELPSIMKSLFLISAFILCLTALL